MNRVGSHYSQVFNTQNMIDLAAEKAEILNIVYQQNKTIPVLVYSGFSGSTFAMAISIALHKLKVPFEQMYIRKAEEVSHGQEIESSQLYYNAKDYVLVFVDDFIALGKTLNYVIKQSMIFFENRLGTVVRPYVLIVTQRQLPEGFFSSSISEILAASSYEEYIDKGLIIKQTKNFVKHNESQLKYICIDERDWLDDDKATSIFNLSTRKVEILF